MGPSDGEMGGFWMSKLVEQLQLCLAVFGAKIKPGKARSSGPHIDDILDILEKEGFLTLTEKSHVDLHVGVKLTAMVNI